MPESFADYESMKVARASKVNPSGLVTVVDNSSKFRDLEKFEHPIVEAVWQGPWFYSPADDSPYPKTNLVFIEDIRFNTGTNRPWTLGGGETDFWIYEAFSRVYVDAIIAGAETIKDIALSVWNPDMVKYRTEVLKKRRHPINVITTRRGELDLDNEIVFNNPELEVVVLTGDSGKAKLDPKVGPRNWVHIESTGPESDLREGMRILKERYGVQLASAIGGRHVATELIDLGLIRDLYLTHTRQGGAEPNTPFYLGDMKALDSRLDLVIQKQGTGPDQKGATFSYFLIVPQTGVEPI